MPDYIERLPVCEWGVAQCPNVTEILVPIDGALKHSNETWDSIKGVEYHDHLKGCQLLKIVIGPRITGLFNNVFKCKAAR